LSRVPPKTTGDLRLDDRKFGIPWRAIASRPDSERIYKPRRGLNDISVLRKYCYRHILYCDAVVIWRMSVSHVWRVGEFERSLIGERTQAGLAAARRAGRTGGRPPKLTDDDIEAAKAMLANPDIGVTQIAHRLGVSPATCCTQIASGRLAFIEPRVL
jgi:Helix-turn-helix domain of resolvase